MNSRCDELQLDRQQLLGQPTKIVHHDRSLLLVRRFGLGIRLVKGRGQGQRRSLLPQRKFAQINFYAKLSVSGLGPRPRRQTETVPAKQQHQAHRHRRRGAERVCQSDNGAGACASERARFRGGVQVCEDVRVASRPGRGEEQSIYYSEKLKYISGRWSWRIYVVVTLYFERVL